MIYFSQLQQGNKHWIPIKSKETCVYTENILQALNLSANYFTYPYITLFSMSVHAFIKSLTKINYTLEVRRC